MKPLIMAITLATSMVACTKSMPHVTPNTTTNQADVVAKSKLFPAITEKP